MARPKKEEKLKHKNYITLKLTDIELACLEQSAEALNISRVEYLRNLILEKPMIYKYEIVADNEQLKKLNAEIGKIGSNLNQIAKHLNQGGVRSMILQDRVHECIDKLFDLRRQVMELAGDYYGDIAMIRVDKIFETNEPEELFVYPPDKNYIPTNGIL